MKRNGKPKRAPCERDPRTGQFLPKNPEKLRRRPRLGDRRAVPAVEQRVLDRVANRGIKLAHNMVSGRNARQRMRATFDALVDELGGPDEAPTSAVLLAERISRRREELRYFDGVVLEMRRKGMLVDRDARAMALIVRQYGELEAEYRTHLSEFSRMKADITLDELHARLEAIEARPIEPTGDVRRGRLIDAIEEAVDAELGEEGDDK